MISLDRFDEECFRSGISRMDVRVQGFIVACGRDNRVDGGILVQIDFMVEQEVQGVLRGTDTGHFSISKTRRRVALKDPGPEQRDEVSPIADIVPNMAATHSALGGNLLQGGAIYAVAGDRTTGRSKDRRDPLLLTRAT